MSQDSECELSSAAQREIHELIVRLKGASFAKRVWERLLNDDDREGLGGDFERAHNQHKHCVDLWRAARNVSRLRGVVDVAYGIDLLTQGTYAWLLREVGETDGGQESHDRPKWDAATGELRFRGELVRRVRTMSTSTNIQRILDKFEEEGWPRSISSPANWDPERAHQTVRSLNRGLAIIRFHVRDAGEAFYWTC